MNSITNGVVSGQSSPTEEEYVIAMVKSHSKQVFELELPEYNNMTAQMLPENICSSKWYSDIVKKCHLKRQVVCQVASAGKIPMLVMSAISDDTTQAVHKYWKQIKKALGYAKKFSRKTKSPLSECVDLLVAVSPERKAELIAGETHRTVQWKYIDTYTEQMPNSTLAKLLLSNHQVVFGVNYHQKTFQIAVAMHTSSGVNDLEQLFNQVLDLGVDGLEIEIWRDEPPKYLIKAKSTLLKQTLLGDKLEEIFETIVDGEFAIL